jgi:hypothetical protein
MDPIVVDFEPPVKRQKPGAASGRLRLEGVIIPEKSQTPARVTRNSARAAKPNNKEIGHLVGRLAVEWQMLGKTLAEIGEVLE